MACGHKWKSFCNRLSCHDTVVWIQQPQTIITVEETVYGTTFYVIYVPVTCFSMILQFSTISETVFCNFVKKHTMTGILHINIICLHVNSMVNCLVRYFILNRCFYFFKTENVCSKGLVTPNSWMYVVLLNIIIVVAKPSTFKIIDIFLCHSVQVLK